MPDTPRVRLKRQHALDLLDSWLKEPPSEEEFKSLQRLMRDNPQWFPSEKTATKNTPAERPGDPRVPPESCQEGVEGGQHDKLDELKDALPTNHLIKGLCDEALVIRREGGSQATADLLSAAAKALQSATGDTQRLDYLIKQGWASSREAIDAAMAAVDRTAE